MRIHEIIEKSTSESDQESALEKQKDALNQRTQSLKRQKAALSVQIDRERLQKTQQKAVEANSPSIGRNH